MIKFILKGLLRDRSRSLFPILTVTIGVFLTVLMSCWIQGVLDNMIQANANLSTGHVKVMTRAYAEESEIRPNDLALLGVQEILAGLRESYPSQHWVPRIVFGGLLDVPDEFGETKAQGPVAGLALDLLSPQSQEASSLNLKESVVRGTLPSRQGEILISEAFAARLGLEPGDIVTLIGSTMGGSMATANFKISGTVQFGMAAMDRGSMIADIADIQVALNMEDAAGEILGFFENGFYDDEKATTLAAGFNARHKEQGEFAPVMLPLREQNGLGDMLDLYGSFSGYIIIIFVVIMSIVLWNAGLMGSIRRYGEIGVRLAFGENKGHLYRSMLIESIALGFAGSLIGTALGLALAYYLQVKGINASSLFEKSTFLISSQIRARVTSISYFLGFIPGVLATLFGTAVSGIGIFKRQTSRLMKELET